MRYTGGEEPGTIVLVTSHLGRYSEFEASLERLVVPDQTLLLRLKSGSSARSQNVGVQKRQGAWVWFIDDDHTFEPDILMRLLAHNKEVVAPLVPMRVPPYDFVLYKQLDMAENNGKVTDFIEEYYKREDLNYVYGLLRVQGLPKAGCLIREQVWARMPMPVFKIGLIHPDEIEDDKYFMWEVRERYKVPLWCDTDQVMGHLTTIGVNCIRDNKGQYQLRLTVL